MFITNCLFAGMLLFLASVLCDVSEYYLILIDQYESTAINTRTYEQQHNSIVVLLLILNIATNVLIEMHRTIRS